MSLQTQILNIPTESYDLLTINPSFNLNITVNSGLPLSYSSANNSVVNVNQNGNVSIVGVGKTVIRVFNSGSINYKPIEGSILINVKKRTQTINFFTIDNKYIDSPYFSLSSYGFTNSGLPIRYRSLNNKVAEIGSDGLVIIKNVGTVYFEAFQEGNFEWDSVSVIKEFGVSPRSYPFELNLTSQNTNTLLKFNLYKVNINNLSLIKNISGGLYFGQTKTSLQERLFLNTGNYIGILNYENIISGSGIAGTSLETYYSFSHSSYTGCKNNNNLAFIVNRSGFVDYGIDIVVHGIFASPYKYGSKDSLQSGIFWTGFMNAKETGLTFILPILNNNKYEFNANGKLGFFFLNASRIPADFKKQNIKEANFTLFGFGTCIQTISASQGVLPYYPKDLGSDFVTFQNPPNLNPNNYPRL